MRILQPLWVLTLIGAACLAGALPRAAGDEFLRPASRPFQRIASWLRSPAPPTDHRTPTAAWKHHHHGGATNPRHEAWYGEAMGVPTYNWGYFGVDPNSYRVSHGSYYGRHHDWGIRRGF